MKKTSKNNNLGEGDRIVPYIPADKILPEISFKAIVLSVLLTLVMAGSNAYLGLKIGMTVSATIPAAVISMAVLRFFRNSNILENNIVQTAASAGEAVAAAVVFTVPALLIMGYWSSFSFWQTFMIVAIGGTLGVMFSIPLRRAFVIESDLKFPEGIATGEVLKAGDNIASGGIKDLMAGGLWAALVKFGQSGLMIVGESIGAWTTKGKVVFGVSTGFSLVLVGAGYIVGVWVGLATLLGAFIAWGLGVPIYSYLFHTEPITDAAATASMIWAKHIRFMGVGTMVVGGLWTMVKLIDPIRRAVKTSLETFSHLRLGTALKVLRTEYDIPMVYVVLALGAMCLPLLYIFHDILSCCQFNLSTGHHWLTVIVVTFSTVFFGFLASAIAGYMAGLVGSSNNPISGVTLMSILLVSVVMLALLGNVVDFAADMQKALSAATMAIMTSAIICNAASISGDNLQDLKSGQIVGATPWKQQVMLLVGVIVGALIMGPIMQVLYEAYGIGTVFPREGMDPAQALSAPTATVLGTFTKAIFTHTMNWNLFIIGAVVGVLLIIFEFWAKKHNKPRMPVLAVAIGIYLPLDIIFPVVLGGLVAYFAERKLDKQRGALGLKFQEFAEKAQQRGLLFASGLIAGEAIIGIILAVPFAAAERTDVFKLAIPNFEIPSLILGLLAFFGVSYYLYHISGPDNKKA